MYDVFEENNTAYMVMELIHGHTLQEVMDQRGGSPLDETTVCGYAAQMVEALEALHQAGLLRRDLKPRNVMVTGDGRVVLINYEGKEVYYWSLDPGQSYVQRTYATHPWRIRDAGTGLLLRAFVPGEYPQTVTIP